MTNSYNSAFEVTIIYRFHDAIASLVSTDTFTSYSCTSKQLKTTASNHYLPANVSTQLDLAKTYRIHNNSNSKSSLPPITLQYQCSMLHLFSLREYTIQIHVITVSPQPLPRVTFQSTPTSSIRILTSSLGERWYVRAQTWGKIVQFVMKNLQKSFLAVMIPGKMRFWQYINRMTRVPFYSIGYLIHRKWKRNNFLIYSTNYSE